MRRGARGLTPVKINCVLLRGFNEDQVEAFGRFAQQEQVSVRFIEFMPLEEGRVWSPEVVVTLAEVLERMAHFAPFHEIAHEPSSTSRRYVFDDGSAEFGVIAPVSLPFCGACSRIRLTSDGKIRTCLFSLREHDLRAAMNSGDGTRRWCASSNTPWPTKRSATTSASPDFCSPAAAWCISADERPASATGGPSVGPYPTPILYVYVDS